MLPDCRDLKIYKLQSDRFYLAAQCKTKYEVCRSPHWGLHNDEADPCVWQFCRGLRITYIGFCNSVVCSIVSAKALIISHEVSRFRQIQFRLEVRRNLMTSHQRRTSVSCGGIFYRCTQALDLLNCQTQSLS